jgi:hypothetical protein
MNAKKLARELLKETGDRGAIIEDAISICSYLSRSRGIELTVEQGSNIREAIDALQGEPEVQA